MARIAESEIERLKAEISLERLVEAKGVSLRRHGKDLMGLCPFHEDREPSLVVTPEKNLWHCLGACQTGGSVIDWVMRAEGVSFRHAVEWLRGDGMTSTSGPARRSTVQKLEGVLERDADDDATLLKVVGYYHRSLKESPEALGYLASRGLSDPELIERHRLGFANRTLGYRLPSKNRKEGAELRGRLQALGVIRESGHEHFNGSIVVPIFDESGRVTEMYGRKITPSLRAGTPLHLYLPGPHRGVWNEEALASSEEVILCESLFDAMTFWCAGYRSVTTSYGVEGFTDDHWRAFRAHGTKVVRIAYDRDEAGERGAEKLSAALSAAGIGTYRVQFPRGMDANEYAQKVQPAHKSLGLALRNAVWMAKGGAAPVLATPPASTDESEPSPVFSLAAEAADGVAPETRVEPASPPASPSSADEVVRHFGARRWRVRGLSKNTSYEQLRVQLAVSVEGGGVFVDTMEMYAARQRAAYAKQAAEELGIEEKLVRRDLGELLLELEAKQDAQIQDALRPKAKGVVLTEKEHEEAMGLLKDPRLLDRVLSDFERCGVVGEETNKLVGYLAAVSRKLEEPLAVVIQSSSAAGKSSLMEAVLQLVPEEERVQYSAMTGQSLFYMGEQDLKHKVLAVAEEEGAERASYALKLLQSEGELTIASTGKDPATGKLVTHAYRVEGPVMIFLTTTAIEVDEELLNRCVVLTVDEGQEQTRAIHVRQREAQTLEGLVARRERARVRAVHKNAQRLLRPLFVVNPFARELAFADARTRTRRDHMKYLTLIRAIALLHQHQRPVRELVDGGERLEYIEVTREDIAKADELAAKVLGRASDELPPQTATLLGELGRLVAAKAEALGMRRSEVRFTRREVRESTSWGNTQLKVHLRRLEELEYVLVHRGGRGQSFVYELCAYDGEVGGANAAWPGAGRPVVGGMSAGGRGADDAVNRLEMQEIVETRPPRREHASRSVATNGASYVKLASG